MSLKTHGEYITRLHHEQLEIPLLMKKNLRLYPWQKKMIYHFPAITKEHFRCKGSSHHADKLIPEGETNILISDCSGIEEHSLPLRNKKEFIYPILIHLLNYIQIKTKNQVVITAGHRCPEHHRYNQPTSKTQYSKHLMGAEVAFYVKNLQNHPEKVVTLIQQYYKDNPTYKGLTEYQAFNRWDKECDTSTPPWLNKEIFIKIYRSDEGRNFDNQHNYPYIAIQVRYDREAKERVVYSWDKANTYWRH